MTNTKIIYQVDAFTQEAFKGNPAGVMFVDHTITEIWMQKIAAEMNLSETAFVIPDGNTFIIRFFTPTVEIPLCGHATLASAHLLYELGYVAKTDVITFASKGGDLTVTQSQGLLEMTFPRYPLHQAKAPENFKSLIGFEPIQFYKSASNWRIAVAKNEQEIINAIPNFGALTSNNLGLLMITSPGDISKTDYVVRCFAPASGINEDPVTGSAQCGLAPLWANLLQKQKMTCKQISERSGDLTIHFENDLVKIKGTAVTVFEAQLKI